jgi:hypothetical protein
MGSAGRGSTKQALGQDLRNSFGSLAIFTAILRASSLLSWPPIVGPLPSGNFKG